MASAKKQTGSQSKETEKKTATLAKGGSKKTELMLKTYELLKETSPENLTIRQIAAACNCTTTVVYKHFDNLEHLILVASVRFLEDYIMDVQRIVNNESNQMEMLVTTWNSFAWFAFENVDSFLMMFWGEHRAQLGDIIFEYYQLMPSAWQGLDGLFATVFFNSSLYERDYIMVRRAAVKGYFSNEDTRMISDIECHMFHGLLMEYKECYRQPGKSVEGYDKFMSMLNALYSKYRLK